MAGRKGRGREGERALRRESVRVTEKKWGIEREY